MCDVQIQSDFRLSLVPHLPILRIPFLLPSSIHPLTLDLIATPALAAKSHPPPTAIPASVSALQASNCSTLVFMGDSSLQASSSSNNNAGATNPAQTSQATGSSQTGPKLNPAAKDYVPRTPINESAVNNSSAANTNGRNRRRRNPETANAAAGAADGSQTAAKSSDNTQANRNRRNRVRPPKQSTGGGARIDDDLDDGSVITMERPVETTEGQPAGSGQGPNGVRRERRDGRDGRRKGKEVVNNSSPKPQQTRGDNARTRPPRNESQAGTSSSARGSGSGSNSNNINNNNNNRRQRDRKGDLGGRTFPTSAHNHAHPEESSSSSQKTPSRPRPAKFVHTVEEDRDLLAALTAGLSNSSYDCMVCWDVIRPAHKIWNCQVCWAAFHLDCLSTWAKKSSEGTEIFLPELSKDSYGFVTY